MGANLLLNGSFEGGWAHPDGVPELQIPVGWDFWSADETVENPHSSDEWNRFVRPEVRVILRSQLPEHEQDLFIRDGERCLKVFKGHGAWLAGFIQQVELTAGKYELRVEVYADLVKGYASDGRKVWGDDPQKRDGLVRLWVNDKAYEWVSLVPGQWNTPSVRFEAEGLTEITVDFMCPFALANSGVFCDAWLLERVGEPDPVDDRGRPREQYRRVCNVIPTTATEAQAVAVFQEAWARGRETVTGSYDDAGVGDLDERVARLYGIDPEVQGDYVDFYKRFYPGVMVAFRPLPGTDTDSDGDGEPEVLGTLATLHLQTTVGWWDGYLKALKDGGIAARWVKLVLGMESSRVVASATEGKTKVVYRHYVDAGRQGELLKRAATDPHGAARSYLDEFWDSVENNPVHAVESLNETIACGDRTGIERTVKFDAAFAEEVHERSGGRVVPVVLTAPPGNPEHGEEVALLEPAVRACIAAGGLLGPHTYFPAHKEHTVKWMETEQFHHHLRPLLSWDATFAGLGLKPRYLFGEAGAVGVQLRADGRPGAFAPTVGWRGADCLGGDLPRYIKLLLRYQELIEDWNAKHGNRCEGFMIFTTGIGVGWGEFLFNETEIRALAAALLG